jgi:hypothetical protein
MPKKQNKKKTKKNQRQKNNFLSFKGMPFEEALVNLLKVKPEPKQKSKRKNPKT